jgi:hypothetical protein
VSGLPDRQVGLSLPGKQLSGSPYPAVLGDWHGRPMPGAALVVDDDGDKVPTFTARGSTITD